MYSNGEVDYLVATDAIGMGLNLDVEPAFAFSCAEQVLTAAYASISPNELAQIAGVRARIQKRDLWLCRRCAP